MRCLELFLLCCICVKLNSAQSSNNLQGVFAWKQITYDINGLQLLEDRFGTLDGVRRKRQTDESNSLYIKYNNVPMGVERVGDRVFVAVPRRRYGIPSTLNYIDLNENKDVVSPQLRPYPNFFEASQLTSVYRTRADSCGRLWMVDTGLLELPVNRQQIHPPAIVIYDLNTNKFLSRYNFKSSDLPAENTPTGLASITVDINGDCADAYAYIPDLTTMGIIVYSLKDNDSWRLSHNYFSFNPLAGNLNISGQQFQWNDGVFSITLSKASPDGCRTAYFHPLISTQEFSISTCLLKNKTASSDPLFFQQLSYLGDRGPNSQSSMHDYHPGTEVIFFADIGRDAVSCWNTNTPLIPENIVVVARSDKGLSYPSDIHVTGDEVWVIANRLPQFGYASLNAEEYNFFVYKGNAQNLIANTKCAPNS